VGQKVIPRPSADYFVVGRRQKLSKNCQKKWPKSCQKVVKKLQKVVKKLSKSCKKLSKVVEKVVKKVVKKLSKSCQKGVKKVSKFLSKSCQKVENSTNSGGGRGGEIVVPGPSASASLTGRRQKER
jgi:gas vesicle protein